MKRITTLLTALLLTVAFLTGTNAQISSKNLDDTNNTPNENAKITNTAIAKYSMIEKNYLNGLSSDNLGIRKSAAFFLGEMKSSKAVVPLMNILRTEKDESLRIMAAWSLIKIRDYRGINLVKHVSENCDCQSVKCLCDFFYTHHSMAETGGLNFEQFDK